LLFLPSRTRPPRRVEMADHPGAAQTVFLADSFRLPAVEEVALIVPGRSGFDPVSHDGLFESVAAVGGQRRKDLVSRAFHGDNSRRSQRSQEQVVCVAPGNDELVNVTSCGPPPRRRFGLFDLSGVLSRAVSRLLCIFEPFPPPGSSVTVRHPMRPPPARPHREGGPPPAACGSSR
jgi:hypothetical protein